MEIVGAVAFLFVCIVLLYITYKIQLKINKQYFKELNDCLYDSLKRAFNDSNN